MPTLDEIQTRLGNAIRDQCWELPEDLILMDGVPVQVRLDVYRNNVFVSLQHLLSERFPAVSRVVHERFFWYASDAFIRLHLPKKPVLSMYGADFPGFLAQFPPCVSLLYLPDLARFEWLIFRAAAAATRPPLQSGGLGAVSPQDFGKLRFELDPSLGLLKSRWPVDRVWRANHRGAADETTDLSHGEVFLEVRRVLGEVGFRRLPAGVFAFRKMLQDGNAIQDAAEAAQAADSEFDLALALADLVHEGVLVGFGLVTGDSTQGE